uniref:Uncharacterized protein n=1 Tax=candidate division WWE3 bacterium TaxID=2053526 RepID=A0A832E0N1_UNCKA
MDIHWEAIKANAPFIFMLDVSALSAAVIFFFYRLERIPRLWIPGTMMILLLARVLDTATFLWSAGGSYVAGEINPAYQILTAYLPSFWAILTVQLAVTIFILAGFWLLWVGRISRRVWLTLIATYSAMTLIGVLSNVLAFFQIWFW